MNNAKLYSEFNDLAQSESKKIFQEFLKFSKLENVEFESLLDVGCGPGETLVNGILPEFKTKPLKVVGIDVSDKMIEAATMKFESKTVKFQVFDIQSNDYVPNGHMVPEGYDLVTSLFCHHWIKNEMQALLNIYNLMKPGGSFMMIFPVRSPFYDVWIQFSTIEKYRKFMMIEEIISPYCYENNPVEVLSDRLRRTGFKIAHFELRQSNFKFRNLKHLEDSFKAINPFKMTDAVTNDFYREGALVIASNCFKVQRETEKEDGIVFSHDLLIFFVEK